MIAKDVGSLCTNVDMTLIAMDLRWAYFKSQIGLLTKWENAGAEESAIFYDLLDRFEE